MRVITSDGVVVLDYLSPGCTTEQVGTLHRTRSVQFKQKKIFRKVSLQVNKELVSRAARVHTKRNIAVRQDVYDYGTLTLLDVSIFTVAF